MFIRRHFHGHKLIQVQDEPGHEPHQDDLSFHWRVATRLKWVNGGHPEVLVWTGTGGTVENYFQGLLVFQRVLSGQSVATALTCGHRTFPLL